MKIRASIVAIVAGLSFKESAIQGRKLVLNNETNREEYSVLIIPGGKVLSVGAARQIKAFYDGGGRPLRPGPCPRSRPKWARMPRSGGSSGKSLGLPDDAPMTAEFNRRIDEFSTRR